MYRTDGYVEVTEGSEASAAEPVELQGASKTCADLGRRNMRKYEYSEYQQA